MEKSFVWVEIIFFRSKKKINKNSPPKENIDWNLEGTKLITKLPISKLLCPGRTSLKKLKQEMFHEIPPPHPLPKFFLKKTNSRFIVTSPGKEIPQNVGPNEN